MRYLINILDMLNILDMMRETRIKPWGISVKISLHSLIAEPIYTDMLSFEKLTMEQYQTNTIKTMGLTFRNN